MSIDTTNDYAVGMSAGRIVLTNPSGTRIMSKATALRLAAWIVALAEERDGEFQEVLDAVMAT